MSEKRGSTTSKRIKFEDEEEDYFCNHVDEKLSDIDTTLQKIEDLQQKKTPLTSVERDQIAQKRILSEKQNAYKDCLEAYRESQRLQTEFSKSRTDLHLDKVASVPNKDKEVKNVAVRELVNLIYFCNYFNSAKKRNNFKDAFDAIKEGTHLDVPPDFDIFTEFYEELFDYPEDHKQMRIKIEKTLDELEHFVNGSQNIAIRQDSYRHLQKTINKTLNSRYFDPNLSPKKPNFENLAQSRRLSEAKIDKVFNGDQDILGISEKIDVHTHKTVSSSPKSKDSESKTDSVKPSTSGSSNNISGGGNNKKAVVIAAPESQNFEDDETDSPSPTKPVDEWNNVQPKYLKNKQEGNRGRGGRGGYKRGGRGGGRGNGGYRGSGRGYRGGNRNNYSNREAQ